MVGGSGNVAAFVAWTAPCVPRRIEQMRTSDDASTSGANIVESENDSESFFVLSDLWFVQFPFWVSMCLFLDHKPT